MAPRKNSFDSSDEDEKEKEEPFSLKRKIVIEEEESDDDDDEDPSSKDDTYESDSSDDSEEEEDETNEQNKENDLCPICLGEFEDQMIGIPENCKHLFCADCIQEWTKNVNNCPVDRKKINLISVHASKTGPVVKQIQVEDKSPLDDVYEDPPTYCEVCGQCDREDSLLLCDGCENGYHMECLRPRLSSIPDDEWYCVECIPNTNKPSSSRSRRASSEETPSTSGRAGTSNDAAARDLMYGQLSRRSARTASTARNERESSRSSRSTSTTRRSPATSASSSTPTKKKKKKRGSSRPKGRKGKSKKGSRSKKAKRKIIEDELEKFRKKLGKGSSKTEKDANVETTKGLSIYGHQFDLDEFFDDDQDFKYDDEKEDNAPRSTICDTPDVIGNILGGFDTLNPNNVTVMRDGTIKAKEKRAGNIADESKKTDSSSEDTNHSTSVSNESSKKRKLSEVDAVSKELAKKNKKRRKIRFLDEDDDESDDDDGDVRDPDTNKKISDNLKKGYLEAMKKKQAAKELQDQIDKMKSETVDPIRTNRQTSMVSVASFKIPKKPKSPSKNDDSNHVANPSYMSTSPKKPAPTSNISPNKLVSSSSVVVSVSPSKTPPNKVIATSIKSRPSARTSKGAPVKENKISDVIAQAKQAMLNAGKTKSEEKTNDDKIESFSSQTQRLSSIVDQRRKSFPERKKKVLTLEEKVSLYQAGKLKCKQDVPRKRRHSDPVKPSSSNTTNDKVAVKPLRSIMRVRAEPSCNVKRAKEISKQPAIKKPISLNDYKERKLMEELFGDTEVKKKEEATVRKKSVKFFTNENNAQDCEEIPPVIIRSNALNVPPLATKPSLEKTNRKFSNTLSSLPPLKNFSLSKPSDRIMTSPNYSSEPLNISQGSKAPVFPKLTTNLSSPTSSNPFGELLAKSSKMNWITKHSDVPLSRPIGVVSPQQRIVDPPPALINNRKPTKPKADVKNDAVLTKEEYISRVKELMKPFYKKGKVNKEQWKTIVKEAVMTIKKKPGLFTTDEEISKLLKGLVANTVEVSCTTSG